MKFPLLLLYLAALQLALVTYTTGCRNGAATAAGAHPEARQPAARAAVQPRDPEPRTPAMLVQNRDEPLACRNDADCTITCRSDGSCCLEQCGCSQPMSRAFLQRLESHLAQQCGPNPLCPMAGCVGDKLYEALCQRGRCTARKLPGSI